MINENILSFALQLLGDLSRQTVRLPRDASGSGLGPSSLRLVPSPAKYSETFADVARAQALSIVSDPDLHYTLYGAQQGREILALINGDIDRVVIISPSHLKECGIGEYGRYLASEFAQQVKEVKVVRTSSAAMDLGAEFLDRALVIINHGPGLFDGLNPRLSQGESTTRLLQNLEVMRRTMGALPVIIHHSLLDTDHELLFSRQSQILNSHIPSLTFISSAERHFFMPTLELGVSPVPVPKHTYKSNRDERPEVVGFFGFFQYGGKDFDSLFHLVRELRGRLVGSVATSSVDELEKFNKTLDVLKLPHDLGSGWVDDTKLLERLLDADYFYLPQNDYDHWNNSATARFVTNLDRPLFLPPHHPFLDMEDGSIFASKDDLPRIVAHFREPGHYQQAVDRVRAFRDRAAMSKTATTIMSGLADRLSGVGQQLMEAGSACSVERMLELPKAQQIEFAAALGVDGSDYDAFPAMWRTPDQRQYWRKHYEIGDLVHGTLLESICAIFFVCAKRPVTLGELLRLVVNWEADQDDNVLSFGQTVQAAFFLALENRGSPFYDPEIVLLESGDVVDWRAVMTPKKIAAFKKDKAARLNKISVHLAATGTTGAQPKISNLVQLLVLPIDTLQQRQAPVDLSKIDFDYVHAVRRPSQRLNRLIAQANDAGLQLGNHLVFDHLIVEEVDPLVRNYVMEDFIHFSGDLFLFNAARCINKRNPLALEILGLQHMMSSLGKVAVLQHLICRTQGRIQITNFDENFVFDENEIDFFMHAARDPLFGLVSARNAYEILNRNTTRWWLRNKTESEALLSEAGHNLKLINMLYYKLTVSETKGGRIKDPIWLLNNTGVYDPARSLWNDAIELAPERVLRVTKSLDSAFKAATDGFYPLEENGVWTHGKKALLLISLKPENFKISPQEQPVLRLELGFFGTIHFKTSRILTLTLMSASQQETLDTDQKDLANVALAQIKYTVTSDVPTMIDLPLGDVVTPDVYRLSIEIDGVISPKKIGVSADERLLGVRLNSVYLSTSHEVHTEA